MNDPNSLLYQPKWRIIDQSNLGQGFQALESFAIDDTLCAVVGSGESPATVRSWVHHDTIVLGIQDTRLPHLDKGIKFLQDKGYHVIVRNSGGLAVVLDQGILNISLIFSEKEGRIDINRGYEAMWELTKAMLKRYNLIVEAKEIVGSYCPGSFDLSIKGKKFAGISQRRLRGGVAVQIYYCVEGNGSERAKLIQDFYNLAIQGKPTKFVYPTIHPETMASISELTESPITIKHLMFTILETLLAFTDKAETGLLTYGETLLFQDYYKRVIERNEKMLHD